MAQGDQPWHRKCSHLSGEPTLHHQGHQECHGIHALECRSGIPELTVSRVSCSAAPARPRRQPWPWVYNREHHLGHQGRHRSHKLKCRSQSPELTLSRVSSSAVPARPSSQPGPRVCNSEHHQGHHRGGIGFMHGSVGVRAKFLRFPGFRAQRFPPGQGANHGPGYIIESIPRAFQDHGRRWWRGIRSGIEFMHWSVGVASLSLRFPGFRAGWAAGLALNSCTGVSEWHP